MTDSAAASLALRGIDLSSSRSEILRGIELEVAAGESFVLLGDEGAGKSALLRIVCGLDNPNRGDVLIDGRAVTHSSIRSRGTVLMQPDFPLWPNLSTLRNVTFVLRHRGVDQRDRQSRASQTLGEVGLGEFLKHAPHQLTHGQRQRVALARTLASEAPVTLLDEPLSAQSRRLREQLVRYLKQRHARHGNTVVIATEDPRLAMSLGDRIAVLRDGEICRIGTPDELYDSPESRHVAELLGQANLIEGRVENINDQPVFHGINGIEIPLFDHKIRRARQGWAMFRPGDATLVDNNELPFDNYIRLAGRLEQTEFRGAWLRCQIDLADTRVWIDHPRDDMHTLATPGDTVTVGIDPARIVILEH